MSKKREKTGNPPDVKRLDELEPECQTIIAKHRGEDCEPLECDTATGRVNAALLIAGVGILRPAWGNLAPGLAENARNLWWEFETKPGGGFDRYDGIRPFVPYGFITLKRICLGRENLLDQLPRRMNARGPKNEKCNPNAGAAKADRRQVPLEFDPVDPRSTDRAARQRDLAETVGKWLTDLPEDQREVLTLRYWEGANLAAVAKERGISAMTLHMRVHKARKTLRERHPDFEWSRFHRETGKQPGSKAQ